MVHVMSEVKVHLAIDLADGEHVVLQPDYESLKFDFNAQRLRADTAEANFSRCNGLYYECQKERNTLRSDLSATEQRIADTTAKLQLAADMLDDDERGNRFAQVLQLAMAALNPNPNPEAESHETN